MANTERAMGFRPYGAVLRINPYTAGGTFYPGDAVQQNNAGQLVVWASGAVFGVAASKGVVDTQALIYDHPDQMYLAGSDDATEPAALTAQNNNYTIITTAGNSTYNISRQQLDGSAPATTATHPFKFLYLDPRADNAFGAKADMVVVINDHVLKGGTGTVGI